jgi:branched-chain amino acid transport system substrate-binding protein
VYGRQLRLVAADDGYEPARAAVTMKQLYESDSKRRAISTQT